MCLKRERVDFSASAIYYGETDLKIYARKLGDATVLFLCPMGMEFIDKEFACTHTTLYSSRIVACIDFWEMIFRVNKPSF